MIAIPFGFLNRPTSIVWGNDASHIEPLPDHAQIVARQLSQCSIHAGWIYPPVGPAGDDANSAKVPQFFRLPATHMLRLDAADASEHEANFLILLFGMLIGRRLQPDGWLHFYKTPLDSQLNDFGIVDCAISATLDIAASFWHSYPDERVRKLAFGALHWHLFAQLYEHEFERFNAQYTALDACAELAHCISVSGYTAKHPPHAMRAAKLCECLRIHKPPWVEPLPGNKDCELSKRRNALIHDALYADEPIGFAYPADHGDMMLGLTALVARVFLALLGVHNNYISSPCTTCQQMRFEIPT